MSREEVLLWLREARCLGRSPNHLASIQRVLEAFERERVDGAVLPDVFVEFRAKDRAEFYRLAFELME